jgi:hypothetical protein
MTTTLASLKLVASCKPAQLGEVQIRRNKLLQRLQEQVALAQAQAAGTVYSATRVRSIRDQETGVRKQEQTPRRVRPWWFVAENGATALAVHYGPRVLELGKGKFAVELASTRDLVPTLELVQTAVAAGELDGTTGSQCRQCAFGLQALMLRTGSRAGKPKGMGCRVKRHLLWLLVFALVRSVASLGAFQ